MSCRRRRRSTTSTRWGRGSAARRWWRGWRRRWRWCGRCGSRSWTTSTTCSASGWSAASTASPTTGPSPRSTPTRPVPPRAPSWWSRTWWTCRRGTPGTTRGCSSTPSSGATSSPWRAPPRPSTGAAGPRPLPPAWQTRNLLLQSLL
ncbi:hypothetical protein MUK42_16870 [Musa troglodytarum]|uniref:Uncharacterized protein n=1 Tax=Musa troglodytarum TaxID=320322 RepID=A0A9E7KRB3_9LILI|nr:hypothetical protein MUK42_16870 [Musa troglodytarum]